MYQFDAEGVMRDIWSPVDVETRKARRACVVTQADRFALPGGGRINGALTVSENVADLAGVAFAYEALRNQIGDQLAQKGDDGLTRSQRFFVSFAQHWCTAQTPASAADDLHNDPHAPALFRVNGPLANLPAFAAAFSCRAGAKMVRPDADRCVVW
jgi:endothelin-converting enzyme/putative endopeptidase